MTGQMFLTLMHTKAGAHKVYVQGHAEGHVMDWNGCNFVYFSVPGQPFRGFANAADAWAFKQTVEGDEARKKAVLAAAAASTGAWIPDEQFCSGRNCTHSLPRKRRVFP